MATATIHKTHPKNMTSAMLYPVQISVQRSFICFAQCALLTTLVSGVSASEYRIENFAGNGMLGAGGDQGPADKASLSNPFGVVRGPDNAIYICDTGNHRVRRVDPVTHRITTVAGTGQAGYTGDGTAATDATLNEPYEVRFDHAGNMYFVEMQNHVVRRVDRETGKISTVAGNGEIGFSGDDGPAVDATFHRPHSIQFGPDRNLYVCDIGNHRIRKIDMHSGIVSTIAGNGKKMAPEDGARFSTQPINGPRAIDFDASGNMWLATREGNQVFRLDMTKGTIHHVAGTGKSGFTGNGGPAKLATLSGPKGISIGPDGNIYLADTESHSVRMINLATGTLELIAGTGKAGDGPIGNALDCKMNRLHGIFVDRDGAIFVGDTLTHQVRVIRP